MSSSKKQKGFTLLELAMVLVVISLLIVSVIRSQELVTNTKIKRLIKDINGLSIAYHAYYDRHSVIPGDSDANGSIDDADAFWSQLRTSGLVVGNPTDVSPYVHSLDGVVTVGNGVPFESHNWICASSVEVSYAIAIDRQLDDALGESGDVRTSDQTAYPEDPDVLITLCKVL